MQQRLRPAFDRFLDVSRTPDREVALLARRLEIDIAVDLAGFTSNGVDATSRMWAFFREHRLPQHSPRRP